MSVSSQNSSGARHNLAMDPGVIARIGEKRYRLIKLWVNDVNGPFERTLARHIRPDAVVLDAGCSRGDPDLPSIQHARQTVGCDVDLAGLRGNTLMRDRVQAVVDRLPFPEGSFDVVVCKWVVEHLSAPVVTFREFGRVLKPGGVLAILTPNRLSPFAVVARLVPYRAKQCLKKYLFGGHEEDTFPTLYRANTMRSLDACMRQAGLTPVQVGVLAGMWAFFIFSERLARFVRRLERIQTKTWGLRAFGTHIIGVWRKPCLEQVG